MSFGSWEIILWGVMTGSFVGTVVSTLILIWGLVGEYKDPHSSVMIELGFGILKKFPFLVIVGVAGELFFNTVTFVSSIALDVWHSDEVVKAQNIASVAYKVGNQARERANELELETKRQNKVILDQAAKAIELELQFGTRVPKAEENIGNLQQSFESDRDKTAAKLAALSPRTVNGDQRARIARALTGKKRLIVLVTINDAEAQTYAKSIGETLTKAKFDVVAVALPTFPDTGVIVCQKNETDLRIFRVLEAVQIATEIKRLGKTSWPTYCDANRSSDATILSLGIFSISIPTPAVWEAGTRIFVGGRIPPK